MILYYAAWIISIFFMTMIPSMNELNESSKALLIFDTSSSLSSLFLESFHRVDPSSFKSDTSDSQQSLSSQAPGREKNIFNPICSSPKLTDQELHKIAQSITKKCFNKWKSKFEKKQLAMRSHTAEEQLTIDNHVTEEHLKMSRRISEEWDITETSQDLSREETENLSNKLSNTSFSSTTLQNWLSDKIKIMTSQK